VNIVADECCDALLVSALGNDGHDVLYVKEAAPGSDDATVLQMSANEKRILLTEDKDFGELVVRLKLPAYGIILLRIHPSDALLKVARLRDVIQNHSGRLPGSFTVVNATKTRFRPL
jgi:predicted nuclease of predicted toxin-antitoxin system